jgi:hypothetical protein
MALPTRIGLDRLKELNDWVLIALEENHDQASNHLFRVG